MNLQEIRQKYPAYQDLSDQELADALYSKYYSDIPREEYDAKIGIQAPQTPVEKGWFDQSLEEAQAGQQKAADLYTAGEQTLPETLLQGAATGADIINTASGKALSAITPDIIEEPIKRGAASAISYLADTPVGDAARFIGNQYGEFAQDNPRAARNLSALGRIGSVVAPFARIGGKSVAGSALASVEKGAVATGKAAGKGLQYAAAPTVAKELVPLAQRARSFDIPLRLDQVAPTSTRKTLLKVTQDLPFSGVDVFENAQRGAWNRALAKTIGQNTENLGPQTIKNFLDDAGKKFDSALKGESIPVSQGTFGRLDDIIANADLNMTDDLKKIVVKNIDKLKQDIGGNVISGEKLASYRSSLLKRIPTAPAGAKQALGEIIDTIDDLVETTISPDKSDILRTARREWRNFRTLEPLLEKSTDGKVDPTQLLNRVSSSKYIKASRSAVGEDDLVDLARIGKELLPKARGSDTQIKLLYTAGGVGLLTNPYTSLQTAAGLAGNRAFQSLYNQSPALVEMALKKGSGSPIFLQNQALRQIGK